MTLQSNHDLASVEAWIAWALESDSTSEWLRAALRGAIEGDPVVVANDAEVLRYLLQIRAQSLVRNQFIDPPSQACPRSP